jgi:phospho-N-acetylmuramoyl-pentapeptide-transferase
MAAVIGAYLLFNSSPSSMLMGDAGSRTFGFFIALLAMKSGHPLSFLILSLVFIIDGGLGLVKVFLLRFLKIAIFKNTRFPLHDQLRKVNGWSDTQVVVRLTIIQILLAVAFYFFFV